MHPIYSAISSVYQSQPLWRHRLIFNILLDAFKKGFNMAFGRYLFGQFYIHFYYIAMSQKDWRQKFRGFD